MDGWMASRTTRVTHDQTHARPDSLTIRLTHDQTQAQPDSSTTRLTHNQTRTTRHAGPDSSTTRLTQDQAHGRHVCNNYSNKLYYLWPCISITSFIDKKKISIDWCVLSLGFNYCCHSSWHVFREGFEVVKSDAPTNARCIYSYLIWRPHPLTRKCILCLIDAT